MDIQLNPEVIEIIDSYMKRDSPLFDYGIEKYCCDTLKNLVDATFREKCVLPICLKGHEFVETKWNLKYDTYFDGSSIHNYVWWNGRSPWGYKAFLKARCIRFMDENAIKIVNLFIKEEYRDMETAIMLTDSFLKLFKAYEQWFENRRKKFMENMEVDIQKTRELSAKKTPQSHGGVANLLKVLTQTMEKQGSDIQSIAKVQYAICVQAGIYIPDEFIRDVAVTLDIPLDKELVVQ